jgi:hypothetical protein
MRVFSRIISLCCEFGKPSPEDGMFDLKEQVSEVKGKRSR